MKLSDWLMKGLDLHVPGIAVWPLILAGLLPFTWTVYLVALVPQGRIFSVVQDRRRQAKPLSAYLIVNEAIVLAAVAIALLIKALVF